MNDLRVPILLPVAGIMVLHFLGKGVNVLLLVQQYVKKIWQVKQI